MDLDVENAERMEVNMLNIMQGTVSTSWMHQIPFKMI